MTQWYDAFTGFPFEDGARGPVHYDCWGIVQAVYRDVCGIDLPSYGDISAFDVIRVVRAMTKGIQENIWTPVEPAATKEFDLCLMKTGASPFPGHIGVMATRSRVLHACPDAGSVIVDRSHHTVKHRIIGYIRHKCLF